MCARRLRAAVTAMGGPLCLLAGSLLVTSPARADEPSDEGDGAYGRMNGDVTLVVGASAGIVAANDRKLVGGELRLRYLDAVGGVLAYEEADAFDRSGATFGDVHRNFIAALELRPLFPIRFLKNMESEHRFFELVLDSIGLDLGTVWGVREANSSRRPGLLLGLGVEVPLLAHATGPWIRLGASLRWSPERIEGASAQSDPGGRAVVFTLGLAWHQVFGSHVVDAGDQHVQ